MNVFVLLIEDKSVINLPFSFTTVAISVAVFPENPILDIAESNVLIAGT